MDLGELIPIVAIAGGLSIPIFAMYFDSRRRQLQSEERRAMIEKGMQPPPLDETPFSGHRFAGTPEQRRDRALHGGISMLAIGIGLALGAWLIGNVLIDTFIPRRVVGPLTLGACVVGFIGIGNLVYYAVSRKRGGEGAGP